MSGGMTGQMMVSVVRAPFARAERHGLAFVSGQAVGLYLDEIDFVVPRGCQAAVAVAAEGRVVRVPLAEWDTFVPPPGALVTAAVTPQGGDGEKSVIQTLLLIAAVAVSFVIPAMGGSAGTFLGSAIFDGSALTWGAAAGFALTTLAGFFAPRPRPRALSGLSSDSTMRAWTISGAQNRLTPYGPVIRCYGRQRVVPPLAARAYTEIAGQDQYFSMLADFGYGPLSLTDLRIGETPIGRYKEVTTEIRAGRADDAQRTLISADIHEESIGATLGTGWTVRRTPANVTRISVDVAFPRGLTSFNRQGGRNAHGVRVWAEWRPIAGSPGAGGAWRRAWGGTISASSVSPVRHPLAWGVPAGQYDVRLRRLDPPSTANNVADMAVWSVLRGFQASGPLIPEAGIASIALRIRASDQLNGPVRRFSAIAQAWLPVWTAGGWRVRPTRSPAWAALDILRGGANGNPLPDNRIDLPAFRAWALEAGRAGRHFDFVFDAETRVADALTMACEAGRAEMVVRNGQISVVRDVAQSVPVQMFTAHNVRDFRVERAFPTRPHGWRVQFRNETKNWARDELRIPAARPGSGPERWETMELPAITGAAQALAHVQYMERVAELRPEIVSFTVDQEDRVCDVGDLVAVTHPVTSWGLGSGRIAGVQAGRIRLDTPVPMEAGRDYALRVRDTAGGGIRTIGLAAVTAAGRYDTVWPAGALATPPGAGDLFQFGARQSVSESLLIRQIQPRADRTAVIQAVHAAPAVLAAGPLPAFEAGIVRPPDLPDTPAAPVIDSLQSGAVAEIGPDGRRHPRIRIGLRHVSGRALAATSLRAEWRERQGGGRFGDWAVMPDLPPTAGEVVISPVRLGQTLDIRIAAVSAGGVMSPWATARHTVAGAAAPGRVSLRLTELVTFSAGRPLSCAVAVWTAAPGTAPYVYEVYRRQDGAWALETTVRSARWQSAGLAVGANIDIAVLAVGENGAHIGLAGAATARLTLAGDREAPAAPTGFMAEETARGRRRYRWIQPPGDPDLAGWRIRAQAGTQNRHWDTARPLHEGLLQAAPFETDAPHGGQWTILIRAVDTSGNQSPAAALVIGLGDEPVANVVQTWNFLDWRRGSGGSSFQWDRGAGHLLARPAGVAMWPEHRAPMWTDDAARLYTGGYEPMTWYSSWSVASPGMLAFTVDGTGIADVAIQDQTGSLFWAAAGQTRFWQPPAQPVWQLPSDVWRPWVNRVHVQAGAHGIRVRTIGGLVQGRVTRLIATVDVPDITERLADVAIPVGGGRLPVTRTYRQIGHVSLTVQGGADAAQLVDKSTSGPLVQLRRNGQPVAGTVDAHIMGF